ncbi:MAG: serine hydrolase domain-containing protein [Akkermansiaceae bacterium]
MNLNELQRAFEKNFTQRGELGASVSVWRHGEEILSLAQGWCEREKQRPWNKDTLVPFYSTTKGLAAATMLLVLEENGISPDDLVCKVWEEFPLPEGTIGQLMSHRLGLAALDHKASVWEHAEVITAVKKQDANWQIGDAVNSHGYHPRVLGFIQDEIVRQLTGKPLGQVWREKIAEPLGLEAWIGLPESEFSRVAFLYPGKMDKSDLETGFYKELNTPGSLVKRAFSSPHGFHSVREMNEPRAWQSGLTSMGGIGTASAVAKFYQAASGSIDFFSPKVMSWMTGIRSSGDDKILIAPTAFSCGFQLDPLDGYGRKRRYHYGPSRRAFGHPGAGGSHAFGDPDSGISFAYVMNQMELSPLPQAKCLDMVKALYL